MLAALLGDGASMATPRPEPTRLREAAPRATHRDEVIDARFTVVKQGRPRLAGFLRWTLAFALAGAIGFLIPPLLVVVQEVMAMLRGE